MRRTPLFTTLGLALSLFAGPGCSADAPPPAADTPVATADAAPAPAPAADASEAAFTTTEVVKFDAPWAMTFLPDGRLLVTEMDGRLQLFDPKTKTIGSIRGMPKVVHRGQGGLGDVVLDPEFAKNRLIYFSYVEAGEGGTGSAVASAILNFDDEGGGGTLQAPGVIWRQEPKVEGDGHFGQHLAFGPDGLLYISSSERQKFDPAQEMSGNLGKIVRLDKEGRVPADNPFAEQGGIAAQVWTLGHRNILGLAFDAGGTLWVAEMGPKGGDELNRIEKGSNYGWPIVSNGDHYDGKVIPDHATRPEFNAPEISWTPVIGPSGFVIYDGTQFPEWKGDGLIGGLVSMGLVRVEFDGTTAREAQRYPMGRRIRDVEQGPGGELWLLEDGGGKGEGWLLELQPVAGR